MIMNCPNCRSALAPVYLRRGVLVDYCPKCRGTWFDKSELPSIAEDPARMRSLLEQAPKTRRPSPLKCPRCHAPLETSSAGTSAVLIDRCWNCWGLWLDEGEREKLLELGGTRITIDPEFSIRRSPAQPPPTSGIAPPLPAVPNLALRSAVVLSSLYGMVVFAFIFAAEFLDWTLASAVLWGTAIILLQYLLSPWLMDWWLKQLQSLRWVGLSDLPPAAGKFIEETCKSHRVRVPRLGIIQDGNPNAFTYGHYPGNARLVLTSGLIEMLDEEELNGVVAHELGHVVHWDILVMTLASVAPIILYYLYRIFLRARGRRSPGPIIAAGCYVLYVISQYVVLFLSRARESYADRFSADLTRKPNALASALGKIAYGLASARAGEAKSKEASPLRSARALGIFDPNSAMALAVSSAGGSAINKENLIGAMQWDLWNPWAAYYELHSTHPLPAKRIKALGDLSWHHGQTPLVNFTATKPESYWDEFIVDLVIAGLPLILLACVLPPAMFALQGGRIGPAALVGALLAVLGAGELAKILFSYRRGPFEESSVAALLKKVKVSPIRSHAVTLKGKIIGRGIPGLIYSEDLVLQDPTGFIFLDYRQPLRIVEFFFGLFRVPDLIGKEVIIRGWYRRAPIPFVEMRSLSCERAEHRSIVYPLKLFLAALAICIGLTLIFVLHGAPTLLDVG